jgi:hypothetical protein
MAGCQPAKQQISNLRYSGSADSAATPSVVGDFVTYPGMGDSLQENLLVFWQRSCVRR